MYGLSKEADVSFLTGHELLQVCFGEHQTILRFDGDTEISMECDYQVHLHGKAVERQELLALLGSKITGVRNQGNGDLMIEFSNRAALTISDSNENFESYQISSGQSLIVV